MFRLPAENVLDDALFVVDPERRVRGWSKGAERLPGLAEQDAVGRKCDLFFTLGDVRDGVPQRELDEALATGRGDDGRGHVRKDGSRFWSSVMVMPLRDGGTLSGFAKIVRDRTDLERSREDSDARETFLASSESLGRTGAGP